MKALILAAGIGSRLKTHTVNKPKALVEVQGKPLLAYQLEALAKNDINEIVIVIGYLGDKIKTYVAQNFSDLNITFIENNDSSNNGSAYSVSLAKEKLQGSPYLHLHCDIFFDAAIIKNLLNDPNDNVIVLDSQIKLETKNQRVLLDGNRITFMHNRNLAKAQGKCVGLAKISAEAYSWLMVRAEEYFAEGYIKQSYYGLINEAVHKFPFHVLDAKESKLLEINTVEHLQMANLGVRRNVPVESLPSFSEDVYTAVKAVKRAGEKILSFYHKEQNSELKEDKTTLTKADLVSNQTIQEVLEKTSYPTLSEEGQHFTTPGRKWVVDPLDGSNDFINKTGEFVIMIGLLENDQPLLGVVYQPTTGDLYVSESGKGAYRIKNNITGIRVNQCAVLNQCQAIVSKHPLLPEAESFLNNLEIINLKKCGSIGLKMALVAAGEADLYFNASSRPKIWDTCAAHCLIKEAGGQITNKLGEELTYDNQINHPHGVFVTNGRIHEETIRGFAGNYK